MHTTRNLTAPATAAAPAGAARQSSSGGARAARAARAVAPGAASRPAPTTSAAARTSRRARRALRWRWRGRAERRAEDASGERRGSMRQLAMMQLAAHIYISYTVGSGLVRRGYDFTQNTLGTRECLYGVPRVRTVWSVEQEQVREMEMERDTARESILYCRARQTGTSSIVVWD